MPFADGHFDWVYIDGNHNEPFVGEDLALARKKVPPRWHHRGR